MSLSEHFSINNVPYGIASSKDHPQKTVATRIEDHVVFLEDLKLNVAEELKQAISQPNLNALAAIPKDRLKELRTKLQDLLADSTVVSKYGVLVNQVQLHLPIQVAGFTDFSCSKEHMENGAEAMIGVRSLPPAFHHFPIGYNGRASSVVVSGTEVIRPLGQYFRGLDTPEVTFGPSQIVDYELEMAAVIGKPSKLGQRVKVEDADEHIFGLVMLNDWSARDIQKLEMSPLGPINGKSFGTSISPWVVTLEALEPFATSPPPKMSPPAPYFQDPKKHSSYGISLNVDVVRGGKTTRMCTSQLSWMYWTFRDLVAQQTINGCNLSTGDLLATGTISGIEDNEHGCLLEMTLVRRKSGKSLGSEDIVWLEDGDEAIFTGHCGNGVGFGECTGVLKPAIPL
ncbi:unnamed protein product [Discula destructiva]